MRCPICRAPGVCICDPPKFGPLAGKPVLTSRAHPLIRELSQLAARNGLRGCVLVSFTSERVAVNSCGEPDTFGLAMEGLADDILALIDNGHLVPRG